MASNNQKSRFSLYLPEGEFKEIHDERERLRREESIRITTSQMAAALIREALQARYAARAAAAK